MLYSLHTELDIVHHSLLRPVYGVGTTVDPVNVLCNDMRVQWMCSLCCVNLCAHLVHFDQCTVCNEYFGICTLQYICVLHIACNARLLCTFLLCTRCTHCPVVLKLGQEGLVGWPPPRQPSSSSKGKWKSGPTCLEPRPSHPSSPIFWTHTKLTRMQRVQALHTCSS